MRTLRLASLMIIMNWGLCVGAPIVVTGSPLLKAFPENIAGFTVGRFIFIGGTNPSNELVAHEATHVAQYKTRGVVGFLAQYYGEMAYYYGKTGNGEMAYLSVSLEREAYGK